MQAVSPISSPSFISPRYAWAKVKLKSFQVDHESWSTIKKYLGSTDSCGSNKTKLVQKSGSWIFLNYFFLIHLIFFSFLFFFVTAKLCACLASKKLSIITGLETSSQVHWKTIDGYRSSIIVHSISKLLRDILKFSSLRKDNEEETKCVGVLLHSKLTLSPDAAVLFIYLSCFSFYQKEDLCWCVLCLQFPLFLNLVSLLIEAG